MTHFSPYIKALVVPILCLMVFESRVVAQGVEEKITVFNQPGATYLYQNQIDLYDYYLSGLMMIKPLGDKHYKIAITTEFGAKILEFEMKEGQFIIHDRIEELNRKKVLKVIQRDMELLLAAFEIENFTAHMDDGIEVLSVKAGKQVYEYWCDSRHENTEVKKVRAMKRRKTLVEINLSAYSNGVPGEMKISHTGKPISITMKLIEHNSNAAE